MVEAPRDANTVAPKAELCDCVQRLVEMIDKVREARSMEQLNKAIADMAAQAMMLGHFYRVGGLQGTVFPHKHCFLCGGVVDK